VVGQTENYGYLGLYKTWGKDKKGGEDAEARGGAFQFLKASSF